MSETKVRLSMVVPGATMISSQDCEKMSKKEAYNHSTLTVNYKVKKGKKTVIEKETLHIHTRKSIPARRNLCISKESYRHMISVEEIPSLSMKKVWSRLPATKRLEYHLNDIAESFGALSFSYEILDD